MKDSGLRDLNHECGVVAVVEDDPEQVELTRRWLEQEGHRVVAYHDGATCLEWLDRAPVDAVILDMHLPLVHGLAVLAALRAAEPRSGYLPILMVTSDARASVRESALTLGASDFLEKPATRSELLLRVRNHLRIRRLTRELEEERGLLEERLTERSRDLLAARGEVLDRLARAAEYRDDLTGRHARRVGALAGCLARELGLPEPEAALIEQAAPLHDVGKIGIPDAVLLKQGRFTDDERAVMATHTTIGARILGGSQLPVLQMAAEIAATHHEWWNGQGILGLAGTAIPVAGRIVCVADVYDALTHVRPYKPAWTSAEALKEVRRESGSRFDPAVVDALERVMRAGVPAAEDWGVSDVTRAA